jgi:serine/threonine protein kinase
LVDGFDLRQLLASEMLDRFSTSVSADDWGLVESKIVTRGPMHSRLKPAVAVPIIRACLSGLASLHRRNIVHADIKPSNIMLRPPFGVKIIDFGSAIDLGQTAHPSQWTRLYAAPELSRRECSPLSDLASLGYVLVELLAGRPLFAGLKDDKDILAAKLALPQVFTRLFPDEFQKDAVLMKLCRKLIEPDPSRRFQTADEADDLAFEHAAQLTKGDLNMNVYIELRRWTDGLSSGTT